MGLKDTVTGLFRSSGQEGLVEMFSDGTLSLSKLKAQADKAGLGDVFDSWVGKGENAPITAEQIKQTADPESLRRLADKAGVTVDEAADKLSKTLPGAVDKLTPDGVLPSDDDVRKTVSGVF